MASGLVTSSTTPTTDTPPRRGWGEVSATLAIRNYRYVITSLLVGGMANWMSRVAQDWLLLEMTGDVALVGLAITFQFAPILLFGLWGGVLSDRFSRLRIVRIAQSVTTASLVVLAVLALTGAVQVWHIYLLAILSGFAAVAENPARSALVTQLVPRERIQTAISLGAMTFHGAGLIGPALSGALIAAFGAGWSLLCALALAMTSLGALSFLRGADLPAVPRSGTSVGAGEALRYSASRPTIRWPLVIMAFLATFGMTHTVLYTAAASEVGYNTGASGYGLYMGLGAVGAVAGAIASTRRGPVGLRVVVGCATAFGVAMLLAAIAPRQWVFLVAIVAFSACRILFGTAAESLVQVSATPQLRGRVAALYFVVVTGGQCGGAVLVGWVAQNLGLHVAYAIAGGIPLLAACTVGAILAHNNHLRLAFRFGHPRSMLRIAPSRAA